MHAEAVMFGLVGLGSVIGDGCTLLTVLLFPRDTRYTRCLGVTEVIVRCPSAKDVDNEVKRVPSLVYFCCYSD